MPNIQRKFLKSFRTFHWHRNGSESAENGRYDVIPDGRAGSREDHVILYTADTLALESPSKLNTVSDSQYRTLALT